MDSQDRIAITTDAAWRKAIAMSQRSAEHKLLLHVNLLRNSAAGGSSALLGAGLLLAGVGLLAAALRRGSR